MGMVPHDTCHRDCLHQYTPDSHTPRTCLQMNNVIDFQKYHYRKLLENELREMPITTLTFFVQELEKVETQEEYYDLLRNFKLIPEDTTAAD